jgi:D-lactate dehydrogenase
MKTLVYSVKPFEREYLTRVNEQQGHEHELQFLEAPLDAATAALAEGYPAVCAFTNDRIDRAALQTLRRGGTRLVALRCAGFNQVDVVAADGLGITVARVPAYSPHAVAEHTIALMLALNRKIYRAHARVREGNFSLDGLMGFDMQGKTAGVVGTGAIGSVVASILLGFGCRVLGFDLKINERCARLGVQYVPFDGLLAESDIITMHCPLTPATHHLINAGALSLMKQGVMLINTSRGAVIDTRAVIAGLKSGRIGNLGLDVYEEEGDLFFRDLSGTVIQDDVFARLLTFPNVLITAHQAFFTREAVDAIASTTLGNISGFARGELDEANMVSAALVV